MHECPNCQRACDCDQEDLWHEYGSAVDQCVHDCEDEDEDDYPPFDEGEFHESEDYDFDDFGDFDEKTA